MEKEGTLWNYFYKASIALMPRPDKVPIKKQQQHDISGQSLMSI